MLIMQNVDFFFLNRKYLNNLSSQVMKQEKMMKQYHEDIENQVKLTMQLLENVKPVEVHHLFRVRLMRRIENELEQGGRGRSNGRIEYKLAFIVLLLVINLGSALLFVNPGENQSVATVGQVAESQSDDYSSQEFAYYDQTTTASYERTAP